MVNVVMKANAEYDLPGTREFLEFRQELLQRFDIMAQSQFRGEKIMQFPEQIVQAQASGLLVVDNPVVQSGPEQGFIWRIGSLIVSSSGTDNAGNVAPPVPSQPAVPASTVAQQNANNFPVKVVISGGTLTAVVVNGVTVGTTAGTYIVPSGGTISVTYSVAPTWVWSNLNTAPVFTPGPQVSFYISSDGTAQQRNLRDATQQVGEMFSPGSRGWYLMPGQGVLAIVNGATAGNVYMLTGQVTEVPAEMMGKLV